MIQFINLFLCLCVYIKCCDTVIMSKSIALKKKASPLSHALTKKILIFIKKAIEFYHENNIEVTLIKFRCQQKHILGKK